MTKSLKVLTVSDIHRDKNLYALLERAVTIHKPEIVALVGDFLDASGSRDDKLTVKQCARALSKLDCAETVFVRGNHEVSTWLEFAEHWDQSGRGLHLLDSRCFTHGPLTVVGFPCLMTHGDGIGADSPPDPNQWLPGVVRPNLPASRTLWLMHEPPSGTVLSANFGPLAGREEWREAIERFSPRLVVYGHDHLTPLQINRWHTEIGDSTCINVGQTNRGPLHYALTEFEFTQQTPSIPRTVRITRFPEPETICI